MTTFDVGGDPDSLMAASRAIRRHQAALRGLSVTQARLGASACSSWRGSASVAYAGRSHDHVVSARTGAAGLEQASLRVSGFASTLRRIAADGTAAIGRRDRMVIELRQILHEAPATHAGAVARGDLADEVAQLRRKIAREESVIAGLNRELNTQLARFGDSLLALVPPAIYEWWVLAPVLKETVSGAKKVGRVTVAGAQGASAVATHRKAVANGRERTAASAMRRLDRARQAARPPDPVGKTLGGAQRVADSRVGTRIRRTSLGARVENSAAAQRVANSPVAKTLVKRAGPAAGVVTGVQDVATGGGEDGARGIANRVSGASMTAGSLMLLNPATAGPGAVLVGSALAWEGGKAVWDNRQSVARAFRKFGGWLRSHNRAPSAAQRLARQRAALAGRPTHKIDRGATSVRRTTTSNTGGVRPGRSGNDVLARRRP